MYIPMPEYWIKKKRGEGEMWGTQKEAESLKIYSLTSQDCARLALVIEAWTNSHKGISSKQVILNRQCWDKGICAVTWKLPFYQQDFMVARKVGKMLL